MNNITTTKHISINISIFDSFGLSSGGKHSEEDKKWEILKKHIPEKTLKEYINLAKKRRRWIVTLKISLSRLSLFYSVVRIFYWPFRRLLSYINYLKTSIKT